MGLERTLRKNKQKSREMQNASIAKGYVELIALEKLKNQLDSKTSGLSNMLGHEPMKIEDYEDMKAKIEKKTGLKAEEIINYVEQNSDLKDFLKKSNEMVELLFNIDINKVN